LIFAKADKVERHARAWRGHPRLLYTNKDVDGRDKPGHDARRDAKRDPEYRNASHFVIAR
jgi:hypothetical protein